MTLNRSPSNSPDFNTAHITYVMSESTAVFTYDRPLGINIHQHSETSHLSGLAADISVNSDIKIAKRRRRASLKLSEVFPRDITPVACLLFQLIAYPTKFGGNLGTSVV